MIEKICDICEKLFFTWLIVVVGITVDIALSVSLIKFFKEVTIIGGIILSIPIIIFIIMLLIFCFYSLIEIWRE